MLKHLLLGRRQDPRLKHLSFPNSLPYPVESLAEMDDRLDLILTRLTEAILLEDWEVGFWKWHREFSRWLAMKVRPPSSSPQSASKADVSPFSLSLVLAVSVEERDESQARQTLL